MDMNTKATLDRIEKNLEEIRKRLDALNEIERRVRELEKMHEPVALPPHRVVLYSVGKHEKIDGIDLSPVFPSN